MSNIDLSDRLRIAITKNGGYEKVSQLTSLSVSTLKRAASGKTEPKFKDIMRIAEATNTSLTYLAYGDAKLNPKMQDKVLVDAIQYFNTGEDNPKIDPKMIALLFSMFGGLVETMNINDKQADAYKHLSRRIVDTFKEQEKSK